MLAAYPAFLDYLLSVYTGHSNNAYMENTGTTGSDAREREDSDPNCKGATCRVVQIFATSGRKIACAQ